MNTNSMRFPYITISDKRCTIQISGCNFRCRGCFSKARDLYGRKVTTTELIEHLPKDKEVLIAGGEPTIYKIPANNFSRSPTIPEIERAVEVAKMYLRNVVSSIDVKSHQKKREIIEL